MVEPFGNQLPWPTLRETEGDIPWAAIDEFTEALVANPSLVEPLMGVYYDFFETNEGFHGLYALAILAQSFSRLDLQTQERICEFLIDSLEEAGDEGDEILTNMVVDACQTVGPVILQEVIRKLEDDYDPEGAGFDLLTLTTLIRRSQDPVLRRKVIACCRRLLKETLQGIYDIDDTYAAAWTLGGMKVQEARPLIQKLFEQTQISSLKIALTMMDSKEDWPIDEPLPLYEWVALSRQELEDVYEEEEEDDDFLAEEENEKAAKRRADKLAREFGGSDLAGDIRAEYPDDVEFTARCLLEYAWTYQRAHPEDLDVPILREVLLNIFPRKISTENDFFAHVSPVVQAFLRWLEEKGILQNTKPLISAVRKWHQQIIFNSRDGSRWGMAKGFAMDALGAGIDPEDEKSPVDYTREKPLRFLPPESEEYFEEELSDSEDYDESIPFPEPIVNTEPKINRNAPCPCGSGKKYKKCCGKKF